MACPMFSLRKRQDGKTQILIDGVEVMKTENGSKIDFLVTDTMAPEEARRRAIREYLRQPATTEQREAAMAVHSNPTEDYGI